MPKNKPKYRKKGPARPKYIENADELAANEAHFKNAAAERKQRRIEAGAEDEGDTDDSSDYDGEGEGGEDGEVDGGVSKLVSFLLEQRLFVSAVDIPSNVGWSQNRTASYRRRCPLRAQHCRRPRWSRLPRPPLLAKREKSSSRTSRSMSVK